MERQDLNDLNSQLPNLKTLYEILVDNKGFYLPRWQSRSCTKEYLLRIVKDDKILKVKRSDITKPPLLKQKKTVDELLDIIEGLLKNKKMELGFTGDRQPDKDWVINVLHYLDPKNPIFCFEDEKIFRDFPKGY